MGRQLPVTRRSTAELLFLGVEGLEIFEEEEDYWEAESRKAGETGPRGGPNSDPARDPFSDPARGYLVST